jgi:predicted ATP-grasp superfamily ATP-dependent carboligase
MKSKYWKGKYLNVMGDHKLLCVDYENLLKDYEMLEQDYEKMMEDVETQQSTDTSQN